MTLPELPVVAQTIKQFNISPTFKPKVNLLPLEEELKSIPFLITNPAFVRKLKNVEAKRQRVLRKHGDHWKCFAHCKTSGCLECTEYFHNRSQLANIDPKGDDWVNHTFKN